MIGEDDAYYGQKYTKSVKCISQTGELLALNIQDFLSRVKYNDETSRMIKKTTNVKLYQESRVILTNHNMKTMKAYELLKENSQDKISPMAYVKQSFWGEPISENRIERTMKRILGHRVAETKPIVEEDSHSQGPMFTQTANCTQMQQKTIDMSFNNILKDAKIRKIIGNTASTI